MRQAIGIRLFFLLVDIVCLFFSFTFVYYLRAHFFPSYTGISTTPSFTPYLQIIIFICCMWLVASFQAGLLTLRELQYEEEIVRIIFALGVILIMLLLVLTMLKMNYNYSRMIIFGGTALSAITIILARLFFRKQLDKIEIRKNTTLLICASTELPEPVIRYLKRENTTFKPIGIALPSRTFKKNLSIKTDKLDLPVLGKTEELDMIVKKYNIEQVHIVLDGLRRRETECIASSIEGLIPQITIHPDPADILVANSFITIEAGSINLNLRQNLVNPVYLAAKRLFDIIFSSLALICLSPVYLIISLAILGDSKFRGPIFFSQKRMGQKRQIFNCYKFRTMAVDAEERLKKMLEEDPIARAEFEKDFKLKNDPRITKIGNWLRKTSLDELPQFFNVLQGTMSVVGPRPIVEDEVEKYARWDNLLFRAKPGVTGLWQVSGRNDVSYEERVMFDRYYIKNWSFSLDFMIIIKTVFTVLYKRGAY